jgi:hypothetical protein
MLKRNLDDKSILEGLKLAHSRMTKHITKESCLQPVCTTDTIITTLVILLLLLPLLLHNTTVAATAAAAAAASVHCLALFDAAVHLIPIHSTAC